ncbi:hypothetical protein COCSUDRAFT_40827 [Coccomyxa subellipsoidea C-169]|uniref:Ankyrin n=1 Tax=Coccomyxa subellipsoidea (strain C-169) TaxID=574566 RepID=I0Z1A9_COCSC|nr:hypothetical protein COCSUDRAFT_40827 [Coccomyxa subellipsoidea C-169]EIE24428.1 hypothetical protein COCSUDRAFT_40827 [Coccomyxa subellipsoidea C-169]|eukprot:XP_005648972.1 hypothetical protein COCSUDRAFT_40827 [Coccomyxa subellipsoidea C-169]
MAAPPTQSKYLALELAAKSGSLDELKAYTAKYICCMPPFRQKQLCAMAAGTGNVDCLKYLRDSDAQWDEMTPMIAAQNGAIDCLRHAYENGCPFDIRVCIYAAEAGQLEALRFAIDTASQPLNTAVAYAAAAKDNLPCLTYMVEKGCKVDPVIAGVAASRGAMSCMLFLVGHGVRLRAADIDYTQAVLPEGGQENASIRSRALCLIFALNQGAKLTRRHWNNAVGASAQRMLIERRKAFYLSIGYAKALTAAAKTDKTTAALFDMHINLSPPKKAAGKRVSGPAAAATPINGGKGNKAAAAGEEAIEEGACACDPVHAPLARIPKDVAEIIAG